MILRLPHSTIQTLYEEIKEEHHLHHLKDSSLLEYIHSRYHGQLVRSFIPSLRESFDRDSEWCIEFTNSKYCIFFRVKFGL